jgi:protocatechuate 3,4-dioxygenase beta subunit
MLDSSELSRREVLEKCVALGAITLIASQSSAAMLLAFEEKELHKPTPAYELGPFYKTRAPETTMLRAPGDPGMPLSISGQILDTRGEKLSNAVVEVWQTDHLGR